MCVYVCMCMWYACMFVFVWRAVVIDREEDRYNGVSYLEE